jgi:xylulokinase
MAMATCILGIDIGTTTVKAVLFDRFGSALRTAQQEYPTHYPARSWAEQDPEAWWGALKMAMKEIIASYEGETPQIAAIGVSSQAPVFIALDEAGKPLDPAMIWMDRRAEKEAEQLYPVLGRDRVIRYSRNRADPFYLAAKLLWFKRHKVDRYLRTHKILQANGYINYCLTGCWSMDTAHASITQLYDMDTKTWAQDVLKALDLSPSMLPDVYECTDIIGEVTEAAARETGLPQGIPVIAGTVDSAASAVEAGIVKPGIAAEMTGTSSVLMMSNDKQWFSPKLITMNHALPDQTLSLAAMSATGASLKWFRDELCQAERESSLREGKDVYEWINALAEDANPRNDIIFLPYMMGERSPLWDPDARGVFFGLSLGTNRGDLIRSIMEGAAYALRHNLEVMECSGERAGILRILGGTSRSRLWNQIKADVLDREIEVMDTSGGAPLGNAILAGMAIGWYSDPSFVLERNAGHIQRVVPAGNRHHFYHQKYEIFLELYAQTKDQFKKMSYIFKGEREGHE